MLVSLPRKLKFVEVETLDQNHVYSGRSGHDSKLTKQAIKGQIFYDSTYRGTKEQSDSQRQVAEWWLPGKWEMGSLMGSLEVDSDDGCTTL